MKKHIITILFFVSLSSFTARAVDFVHINDIFYNTPLNEVITTPPFSNGEYIELFNAGHSPANLAGWVMRGDGVTKVYEFGEVILPPQSFLLLVYRHNWSPDFELSDLFYEMDANAGQIIYQNKITLRNTSEFVRLYDASGLLRDSIFYGNTTAVQPIAARLRAENANGLHWSQCLSVRRKIAEFDERGVAVANHLHWQVTFARPFEPLATYTALNVPDIPVSPARPFIPPDLNLSAGKNYIVSVTPLDATSTVSIANDRLNIDDDARALVNIQYLDGLGRPEQLIMRGITPSGADLVALTEYDAVGRESRQWLPGAVGINNDGAFVPTANAQAASRNTNEDNFPFNEIRYDNSPLNRVHRQFGAGNSWHYDGKAVVTEYMSNTTTSGTLPCPWLEATSVGVRYQFDFAANEIYVTKITDENDNVSYTFTNKQGQLLMTQQGDARTAYVYDDFGNLAYVLPPMAMDGLNRNVNFIFETDERLKDYAFIYKYDERNRNIAKKLPGAEWIYYVYDRADRLILSQDGNQRAEDERKWTFYKYDDFGRLTISGTFINPVPRTRAELAAQYGNWLVVESASATSPGLFANRQEVLLRNYYDTYNHASLPLWSNAPTNFVSMEGYDAQYASAKGLLTGTWTKILNDFEVEGNYHGKADEKFTSYYYDHRGRLIQKAETSLVKFDPFVYGGGRPGDVPTVHYSHYLEKDKYEFYKYSFTGKVLQQKNIYILTGNQISWIEEQYRYEYDHADRLLKTYHQINDQPEVLMSQLEYGDLGRVQIKKLHGGIETTYYDYNVRGWLQGIYSADSRFWQMLNFDYGGNVSSMYTANDQEQDGRYYEYTYDNLNRL